MKTFKTAAMAMAVMMSGQALWALGPSLEAGRNESGLKFGEMKRSGGVSAESAPRLGGEFRDAVSDSSFEALKTEAGGEASGVSAPEPEIKPFYVETGSRKALGNKGYVAGTDSLAGAPVKPVEFITIPGGKFTMGT
ncbi:MAG: hypothetical protein PHV33_07340, partial [Elusimicrobiales bacterium]|nr:hypothetical protein [Elusimicrobiales bacterium]